jgi:hypothetical protein
VNSYDATNNFEKKIWWGREKAVSLQPIYVGKARTSGYRVVLRLPMEP